MPLPPSPLQNHHAEDSDECTAAATHVHISASNGSRDSIQRASSHYYHCWCSGASPGVSAGGAPVLLVLVFLVAFMLSAEIITIYGYI